MKFGSKRDFDLLVGINRELIQDVIEQEILYYKIDLESTNVNSYGESTDKTYFEPVKLNCLITRGDQVITQQDYGPDLTRTASFAFIRQDLVDTDVLPEVGDIIEWQNTYYEADTVKENQLFVGRDSNYNLTTYGGNYGSSLSIIVDCHMTRVDKTGIREIR